MNDKNKGYILIGIAGLLWSTIGLFSNNLMNAELNPQQVAFIRLSFGCAFLVIYSLLKQPSLLKINKSGLLYSIVIGLICQAGFNLCYLNSIQSVGVSVAAVLLYTSPLFLAIFSKIVFKEEINKNKIISLIFCFLGAILAVTGGNLDMSSLNSKGLAFGILAAITYALMPIFNKNALKENSSITLLIYSFLFGTLFMIPISNPMYILKQMGNAQIAVNMIGMGLLPAALAYIFYMNGIAKGVELSVAGVIASVELIFAQIIGWVLIGEAFSVVKLLGLVFMIISAIIAIKGTDKPKNQDEFVNEKQIS
ncbi:MAG: DMT family transporter [Peptostreptococcaceae bacterium]